MYEEYRVGAITMSDRTEYISRQAAIDLMMKTPYLNTGGSGYTSEELHLFLAQEISGLPSADVQPVRHGRWIKTRMPVTGAIEIKCSECDQKYYTAFPLVWGYCPNCGARMDGE